MKVFLANAAFDNDYGYISIDPLDIFSTLEKAQKFCLEKFVERETQHCSVEPCPEIYKRELQFAVDFPEKFIAEKILVVQEMDNIRGAFPEYVIVEFEVK